MRRRLQGLLAAAVGLAISSAYGARVIEVDVDGLDDGVLSYSPYFSFGGDTTVAYQSVKGAALGLSGGDSIYGGNGSNDTYVFSYIPGAHADNLFLDPGTPLGNGDYATGATGGGPGRYAVYATWPTTSNVAGGLTNYQVVTAGSGASFAVDQNSVGNVWVKLGEVDHTSGPITVTQTPTTNAGVSMRAAGVLFELVSGGSGGGYTGPPGTVFFGEGDAQTFGIAFRRSREAAQATQFAVVQGADLVNWSTSGLKLVSITDLDAEHELVTFRSMTPTAALDCQFLAVRATPKMPATTPYVALTFDDGPHPERTPRLLDLLAARNIRATFFVIGTNAQRYPDVLRRMLNEGHEIANHTLSHPYLTDLTDEEVIAEVAGCRDAVVAAATVPTAVIRPPYGDVDNHLRNLLLSEFGYPTILWDVDSRDWETAVPDSQVIANILAADHGDIILCHDVHERTITVMPAALDGLLARGFSFVTVTELLELGGN